MSAFDLSPLTDFSPREGETGLTRYELGLHRPCSARWFPSRGKHDFQQKQRRLAPFGFSQGPEPEKDAYLLRARLNCILPCIMPPDTIRHRFERAEVAAA